ncbi:hypothetical protein AB6869_21130 [Rahnella rivi]
MSLLISLRGHYETVSSRSLPYLMHEIPEKPASRVQGKRLTHIAYGGTKI